MSYEVDDVDRSIGGAGDATQEPTTSQAIDSNEASKIANSQLLRKKSENRLQMAEQLH
jgi:hypothetical protein